ncbi:MAG: DUF480 domain-containing protein [Pirellulales bacterium]
MSDAPTPKWKPLRAIDRRVLGVLIEKAKTVPDQYPMSINALVSGCNQKSNRDPQMNLDEGDMVESIDRLRMMTAAAEVQGGGRVPRYRHYGYEWFGCENKKELAVLCELLLRGPQTEGELRRRVARMEDIADLDALRDILNGLTARKLVISLTPPGRGHVVSHTLYEPRELENERAKFSALSAHALEEEAAPRATPAPQASRPATQSVAAAPSTDVEDLRGQVRELRGSRRVEDGTRRTGGRRAEAEGCARRMIARSFTAPSNPNRRELPVPSSRCPPRACRGGFPRRASGLRGIFWPSC